MNYFQDTREAQRAHLQDMRNTQNKFHHTRASEQQVSVQAYKPNSRGQAGKDFIRKLIPPIYNVHY